jgi:hypothetical protein
MGPKSLDPIDEIIYEKFSRGEKILPDEMSRLKSLGVNTYDRIGGGKVMTDLPTKPLIPPGMGAAAMNFAKNYGPKALGTAGAVGLGMLIPKDTGEDPSEDLIRQISQQEGVQGRGNVNLSDIDAIMQERASPSPRPSPELYSSIDSESGAGDGMLQRASQRQTPPQMRQRPSAQGQGPTRLPIEMQFSSPDDISEREMNNIVDILTQERMGELAKEKPSGKRAFKVKKK